MHGSIRIVNEKNVRNALPTQRSVISPLANSFGQARTGRVHNGTNGSKALFSNGQVLVYIEENVSLNEICGLFQT
jgi:hypothetical protein